MKTFLIATLLWLCVSANAQTHVITFGKGENCSGYNICSLVKLEGSPQLSDIMALVKISMTKDWHLVLSIPKNKLNDKVFFKYFSTGFFVLDSDYKLPADLAAYLKIDHLKMGKYKVTASADAYEVVF